MTRDAFNELVQKLRNGDNTSLEVLQQYQRDCTRHLVIKSRNRCQPDMAYDLFVDAVLDFRKNVLRNKVQFRGIKAYLKQICWYKWLEYKRMEERGNRHQEEVRIELYESQSSDEHDSEFRKKRLQLVQRAMQELSDKCRRILHLAIVDELPMAAIAAQVGLANANVAKTTKSRCYKQLLKAVKQKSG